jgi:hypothetical protein
MCGHGWPAVCGVPVSVHVMQIYWLLRTISEDQRGSNKAILSLLQSCEEAAMHVHLPVYGAQSQHALGSGAERLAQAATQPGGNAASTTAPPQARGQDRLSRLSMQLGNGEGVTQLVQASMDDLSSGGTGVLSRSPPSDPAPAPSGASSARRFRATAVFLDIVCACSTSLVPVPPPQRMSALRQRLEDINARLIDADLHAQVRTSRLAVSARGPRPVRTVVCEPPAAPGASTAQNHQRCGPIR